MTDGADPPEQPSEDGQPEWFTVRRAEVTLAVSVLAIAGAYLLPGNGSTVRFLITFAAGASALLALRFLIGGRKDRG